MVSVASGIAGFFYRPLIALCLIATIGAAILMLRRAPKTPADKTSQLDGDRSKSERTNVSETPQTNNDDWEDPTVTHLGVDPETGFITYPVFAAILEAKVATARRRLWPVTVVQLQLRFSDGFVVTDSEANAALISFAALLRLTLRDADVVSRIGLTRFSLILEDTDEEGGAWVAERLQVAQVKAGGSVIQKISAGVAGYPTNGAAPKELVSRSTLALEHALTAQSEPGIGRVVVAPTVPYKG